MSDGYYINSLSAMKAEMQKRHRSLMARYTTLERTGHPTKVAQGRLIDLNKYLLEIVSDHLDKAKAEP